MAYGGIYGAEANLTFSGAYTPPSGSAVNLGFVTPVYTFSVPGKSTLSLFGRTVVERITDFDFTSGTTSVYAEQPYRSTNIFAGSLLAAETALRSPDIASGSTTALYFGYTTTFSTGSTPSLEGRAAKPIDYAIATSSTPDARFSCIYSTYGTVSSRSMLYGSASFNKDFLFNSFGKSTVSVAPSFVATSTVSIASSSAASAKAAMVSERAFDMSSGSAASGVGRSVATTLCSPSSGSTVSFVTVPSRGGAALSSGSSVTSFISSYNTVTPTTLPVDADFAYVMSRSKSVYSMSAR